jgi:RecA-family ATPase
MLDITTISQIEEEQVTFLTKPYIPNGKLILMSGDPNCGKTNFALAICAAVTTGEPLPWETERGKVEPASVIFQSQEDGYGDTIKPRLMRLGADYDRVHVINEDVRHLSLEDSRIEHAIVRTGAKLAVFDPITSYINGFEISNSGAIRPILTQLADVAARTGCSICCICHLNKSGGKSAYRILGSIDVAAIARSVIMVAKMPDDEEISVIYHAKSNLSTPGKPYAFGFDENGGIVWLGEVEITLDELLSGKLDKSKRHSQKSPSQSDNAKQFITAALSSGVTAAAEIKTLAESAGISKNTLERAKSALGVKSVKQGEIWRWELSAPNEDTQEPQE